MSYRLNHWDGSSVKVPPYVQGSYSRGQGLAEMLGGKVRKISEGYNERSDRVVVAIPTGGLLVAYPVARETLRKIGLSHL